MFPFKEELLRPPTPRDELLVSSFLETFITEETYIPIQGIRPHGGSVGERKLICGILERAMMDVHDPLKEDRWTDAAKWINGDDDSDEFEEYCFFVKVKPESVRDYLENKHAIPKKGGEYDFAERKKYRIRWKTHRGRN